MHTGLGVGTALSLLRFEGGAEVSTQGAHEKNAPSHPTTPKETDYDLLERQVLWESCSHGEGRRGGRTTEQGGRLTLSPRLCREGEVSFLLMVRGQPRVELCDPQLIDQRVCGMRSQVGRVALCAATEPGSELGLQGPEPVFLLQCEQGPQPI